MDSDSSYLDEDAPLASAPDHVPPSSPPQTRNAHAQVTHTSAVASPQSKRIVPALVSSHQHAQGEDGETYFTRPNRYFGPASTWLSWTQEERTTVLSLDRLRSQDLSVHLLGASKLKRKAQELVGRAPKRSRKGKERAESAPPSTSGNEDGDELLPQSTSRKSGLSKAWTAWPMPPDQVPREELLPEMFANGARRRNDDDRPSANLEEWLVATATRIARERWNAREWEKEAQPVSAFKRDMTIEHEATEETLNDDPFAEGVQTQDSGDDGDSPPATQPADQELFYSQPVPLLDDDDDDAVANIIKDEDTDNEEESNRRPVPLADDAKARQYFLASARHILSKLDDLLLGLHKARYAYASKPPGRARGKYSHSQTPEDSDPRGRSRSRPASRRRARSSSANSDMSGVSTFSTTSAKRSRRVEDLGLRDWSDVMGMASLTGWDPAIVARASERCAKLFGENMLFRTFHEGEGKEGAEAQFEEHLAAETSDTAVSTDEDTEMDTSEEATLVVRTSRPCFACTASKSQCDPSDDMAGVSRSCRACVDGSVACSGIQVSSIEHARVCPHRSCPRHGIPFRKQYHLQRHLDSMHAPGARSRSRSGLSSVAPSEINTSDLDDFSRSASQDVGLIVCPVQGCPRSTKPFAKGKLMYKHVRRMHPEVDVKQVKRNEVRRRGERSGRWTDERRHRSQSRAKSVGRSQSQVRDTRMAGADSSPGQRGFEVQEIEDDQDDDDED
ncbi:hypothetical protein H2200_010580 [Cladophialophora chaetospira]|uniref:Rrn9 domain-containing protein n=1 Tax=Cladophialophora chaetospira TaxID=386627 RepID=A0AA38X1R5_9EURO|nr:hypothetical protein H2200_010580 [Cladophialophora chaetospira]